jgi:hypothetical protein
LKDIGDHYIADGIFGGIVMEPFCSEYELAELIMRIFSDIEPLVKADAVYIFSETPDNEDSGIDMASFLHHKGKAELVTVLGQVTPNSEYPRIWIKKLIERNVPRNAIVPVPFPEDIFAHTHTEAVQTVSYAKNNNWKMLYVTAAPAHLLRSFVEIVSVALRIYPKLRIYCKPGDALSWTERVDHSQSVGRGQRFDFVASELDKIKKYREKGDLASGKEILEYLNRRDE